MTPPHPRSELIHIDGALGVLMPALQQGTLYGPSKSPSASRQTPVRAQPVQGREKRTQHACRVRAAWLSVLPQHPEVRCHQCSGPPHPLMLACMLPAALTLQRPHGKNDLLVTYENCRVKCLAVMCSFYNLKLEVSSGAC